MTVVLPKVRKLPVSGHSFPNAEIARFLGILHIPPMRDADDLCVLNSTFLKRFGWANLEIAEQVDGNRGVRIILAL